MCDDKKKSMASVKKRKWKYTDIGDVLKKRNLARGGEEGGTGRSWKDRKQ